MTSYLLILYSRLGCCLCEALENHLDNIPLNQLQPSLELVVVDIDSSDVLEKVRFRYQNEVPVMLLQQIDSGQTWEFPRVSPRLQETSLFNWLQKTIFKTLESH